MSYRSYTLTVFFISSFILSFAIYPATKVSVNGRIDLNRRTPNTYTNPADRIQARKTVNFENSIVRAASELNDSIEQDLRVLLQADNKDILLDKARRLGQGYKLPFWRNIWAHLSDQHEIISEGTPLHRACHLIKKDLESLQKMSKRLYKKGFATHDIFFEIQEQIGSLQDMISTIKSTKDFVEESRDSQAHYDRQAQIRETQRQTEEIRVMRRETTQELKKINSKPTVAAPTYVVVRKEQKIYC